MRPLRPRALLLALCLAPAPVLAQDYVVDLSQIDPAAILASAGDVLMRAPDAAIDDLFQAAHRASQTPRDAATLCALFDPHADRSFEALAATANRLGPDSRQRFGTALLNIAAAGAQSPRQPFDAAAATKTLKQAGVTAMLLHDDFMLGMTASGADAASRDARCRSFGWMLDALKDVPLAQRAAATRLMLNEGLQQLGPR
ncbi:hypothetical protein [Luteimonas aquatica]|uniref:hypothetical protein n=1 Tax=Luteimonas aquatica TaxID=450364 RepID=UPI001F5A553B|nr:hypothetical protein [Luteimonas aquatica]